MKYFSDLYNSVLAHYKLHHQGYKMHKFESYPCPAQTVPSPQRTFIRIICEMSWVHLQAGLLYKQFNAWWILLN